MKLFLKCVAKGNRISTFKVAADDGSAYGGEFTIGTADGIEPDAVYSLEFDLKKILVGDERIKAEAARVGAIPLTREQAEAAKAAAALPGPNATTVAAGGPAPKRAVPKKAVEPEKKK